jgi:FlaA1/EpsC-like NDP-sugar epimerase
MIARDMLVHRRLGAVPIGFIDDDPNKTGLKIHDLPVFGAGDRLQAVIDRLSPDEILVAIPSADPRTLRRIVKTAIASKLPIKTLPRLKEIPTSGVTVNEVRPMSVADLLAREPIGLDNSRIAGMIAGRCVLITGAAGSIGSELCRQILHAGPSRIVLYERYENGLFTIHSELLALADGVEIVPAIGDITDAERLGRVFQEERPSIVFHAAAHKHVPLMEANPSEAVKNNVRGTRLVAETALQWNVDRIVLISTDKAVNPSSVMGATKLLAERIIQQYSGTGESAFTCVRFGNVLGSNGSVVPTFLEQIRMGGPVTITHPEMRRFFMLIPEAVQLVLQAAALGGQGNVYVLNMGEQVRVADMARDLIRLAGYIPGEDIEIVFTGVRPGEKLSEELVGPGEELQDSEVTDIKRVRVRNRIDREEFASAVERLEQLAIAGDDPRVVEALREMVPALNLSRPAPISAPKVEHLVESVDGVV